MRVCLLSLSVVLLIAFTQVSCGRVNSVSDELPAAVPGDFIDLSGDQSVAVAPAKRVRA